MKKLLILFLFVLFFISCKSSSPVIKIAIIAPLDFKEGKAMKNGALLAQEEINSSGGIIITDGNEKIKHKIELVFVDDKMTDVSFASKNLINAIKEKQCSFIIGGFSSMITLSLMDIMAEHKILWFGTGGASTNIIKRIEDNYEKYKYYFRSGSLDTKLQGETIVDFANNKLKPKGYKKVAIIGLNHSYAKIVVNDARKRFLVNDYQIITEDYVNADETDFSQFFKKAEKADFIVCVLLTKETNPFVKQASKLGINKKMPIIGSIGPFNSDYYYEETNGAALYITGLQGQGDLIDRSGNGRIFNYVEKYKKKHNKIPYWPSYPVYDAHFLIKTVVEKINSFKTQDIIKTIEHENFEYEGIFRMKWYKQNHDLYSGKHNDKYYGVIAWFQIFEDGKRYCVYPDYFKQKDFFIPGLK